MTATTPPPTDPFPGATGETGELLTRTDWSRTPLGPIETWPRALVGYVGMIMAMPMPAIVFWGPEQTQIYNDGYAVIMGPLRHPRFFGAPYRESWPDTHPVIYPWMRRVLDHGEPWTVERAHIPVTRHGFDEEAYFTFTFTALRGDDGRIEGILQPVFDVGNAVLADRRAQTLRLLVPAERAGAAPVDDALAAIAGNPGDLPFARVWLWDADAQALAPASHVGIVPDADELAQLETAARLAWQSGPTELPSAPGTGWRAAHLLPLDGVPGGRPVGVVALATSVRLHFDAAYREFLHEVARQLAGGLQRDRARQAEARHRQYLDDLFLQVPAGIAVLQGPEHVFELVNPTYDALTGRRGLVGRPIREAMPELVDQPVPALLDEVYRSGLPYVGTELGVMLRRSEHGAPEEAFFNFVYQPLRDALGAVRGILVFTYEVTVQVRARLRAEGLADELREEQHRKDDFLAMLAHELRNPLAPISAAAQVMRLAAAKAADGDERLRRTADIVGRQVAHMASLVDDLLDASRVTRGIVTIERRREDLAGIVATAIEQARPVIEARGHRLALDVASAPLRVDGDRKRLVQVVANLLDNAAKYTPAGGDLRLSLQREDDVAVLRVADRGVGIPADLLPRVFDLFVQGARSVDRSQGGLGIGLALVRRLVELHGGSVTGASAGAGQGSEFTVRLPLVDDATADPASPAAHDARSHAANAPPRPRRVLIVDDNADAAQMLALLVEAAGHQAIVEHHPRPALQRAAEFAPDVCLLDIGLPDIDGRELARRLREAPATAEALLIAVTGYGQEADRRDALAAGFDHFLVKPPPPDVVMALLVGERLASR